MVSLTQLLVAILASAVAVFVASSLIHMVLKYHNSDYRGLADEEAARAALRASSPAPGQYFIPYCPDMKDLQKPEVRQKFVDGPIAMVTVKPSGAPTMGPMLGQWFVLNLAIAVVAGYLASRTLPAGASFLAVCRVVSLVTFSAYAFGNVTHSIWMGKPWASTVKDLVDAFIYALVSAVVFALLWPR